MNWSLSFVSLQENSNALIRNKVVIRRRERRRRRRVFSPRLAKIDKSYSRVKAAPLQSGVE